MNYQSFRFLIFVLAVLAAYYTLGKKRQRYVLAAANLLFYCLSGIRYLPFLLATTVSTFLCGRKMGQIFEEAEEKMAGCDAARKKQLRQDAKAQAKKALGLSMLVTIGLLAVCKYALFVAENLNIGLAALGAAQIPLFKMILPLGISFYSFMALSYVLDVYWRRIPAEKNFLLYAVFLSYFPHVVQGPIDRFSEFKEQVKDGVDFDPRNLTFGAQLAIWGFFKKLVIADRIGMFVDNAFQNWASFKGFVLIAAVAAYSIQIYADFSGCIDIVTGVSRMLGIDLRKNFNHPYFSRSMAEFWRRWHISLQEWFKDYVYFPVSTSGLVKKAKKHFKEKNRKKASELFASCFPILVVWLITGIWHGAAWTFVVWGLFHAAVLIGSHILEGTFEKVDRKLRIPTESFVWRLWQMLRTFVICCIGRVFFRADSVRSAFSILKKMMNPRITLSQLLHPAVSYGISTDNIIIAAAAVVVLLIVDILQEKMHLRETLEKRNIVIRWVVIYAALFAVLIFGVYGSGFGTSFIYEQF